MMHVVSLHLGALWYIFCNAFQRWQINSGKMKIFLLISLLSLSGKHQDKWFAKDKFYHLSVAYFLYNSAHLFAVHRGYSVKKADDISIGFVLSVSVLKELYDLKIKKTLFSIKDLTFDSFGILLGFTLEHL